MCRVEEAVSLKAVEVEAAVRSEAVEALRMSLGLQHQEHREHLALAVAAGPHSTADSRQRICEYPLVSISATNDATDAVTTHAA